MIHIHTFHSGRTSKQQAFALLRSCSCYRVLQPAVVSELPHETEIEAFMVLVIIFHTRVYKGAFACTLGGGFPFINRSTRLCVAAGYLPLPSLSSASAFSPAIPREAWKALRITLCKMMGWASYSRLLSTSIGWVTWYADEGTIVAKCIASFQPLIFVG